MTTTFRREVSEILGQARLTDVLTAYIGGEFTGLGRGGWMDVDDPATGAVIAGFETSSAEVVDAAVRDAHEAYRRWRAVSPAERGRLLAVVAAAIRRDADLLARLESIDSGKPLIQAQADIAGSARYFEYYAGLADKIHGETLPQAAGTFAFTRREPLGVVAHITPWNAPLTQLTRGVAPCLAAGNAVVVKPSELTPLTSVYFARLLVESGLPAGLCNLVLGAADPTGKALTEHELIRHITFTGSVAGGRAVGEVAARRIIGVNLELGGKSPTIICADADLAAAARAGAQAVVRNSGQSCFATTRLLVDRTVLPEFVELLAARMAGLSVGHGLDDPDVGPLISDRQLERVVSFIDSARTDGARVVTGGDQPAAGGRFINPTLVQGVTNDMRIAREEVFGPVQSVLEFGTLEEAIAIANDTEYGLSAGVFTRDVATAHRVAERLEAGQVQVNRYIGAGVEVPFGGYKNSGLGREKGTEAVQHYTQVKSVIMDIS
ncbi:aldehyde dehydrogenase family protein [Nocardia flavorosea]|uniref:Aldehyde dehydrogenase n=1 Tax=Nocardia flavorosea TaxID=53429 RepID=A0A846YNT7_9NOCA|nr:aldehyde dehydrogenase family protein [Nocardia flavorosea]NKY58978.1 aldehyde dehydrogenase [Nocardia flavorosea]